MTTDLALVSGKGTAPSFSPQMPKYLSAASDPESTVALDSLANLIIADSAGILGVDECVNPLIGAQSCLGSRGIVYGNSPVHRSIPVFGVPSFHCGANSLGLYSAAQPEAKCLAFTGLPREVMAAHGQPDAEPGYIGVRIYANGIAFRIRRIFAGLQPVEWDQPQFIYVAAEAANGVEPKRGTWSGLEGLESYLSDGWDGNGARALDQYSIVFAAILREASPSDLPEPDIAVGVDGALCFEWSRTTLKGMSSRLFIDLEGRTAAVYLRVGRDILRDGERFDISEPFSASSAREIANVMKLYISG